MTFVSQDAFKPLRLPHKALQLRMPQDLRAAHEIGTSHTAALQLLHVLRQGHLASPSLEIYSKSSFQVPST